jgi:iron complex outermembrane recepter protein
LLSIRLAGTRAGRRKSVKRHLVIALAAGFALAALTHAHAEDAVVVTATRFPERLLTSGVGMIVLNADAIAASTATTLPELLARTAGINVRNNSGSPDLQLDMRGFGITGDQNTLVLLDGIRINQNDLGPTQLSAIPLNAIERIEILPGGGAVLYGGGASGGTINIITRGPSRSDKSGAAYAGVGSYAGEEARASLNAAGKEVGLSLSASHLGSDGYRRNNRLRQDNITGDLRFFGDKSSLAMKFGGDQQRLGLPGPRDENQYVSDPRGATNPSDWSAQEGGYVTLQGRTDVGGVELAADLNQRDQRSSANYQSLGSYLDIKTGNTTFSPRLRWTGAPGGADASVVAGMDIADWDYHRRIAGNAESIGNPFSRTDGSQSSRAIYVQGNVMVTPATKLSAGARSQRVQNELTSAFGGPGAPQEQTRSVSAGEIGLHHALGERWAAFGKLGTSFRFATVDENGYTASGQLLEPQTARQGEAGIEYRENGTRLRATFYVMNLDNEIYFSPLVVPYGANTNLSPTRREGLEIRGAAALAKSVELSGNLALQSARFRSGVYGGVDVSGRDIPLVPRLLATLRLAWQASPKTRLLATVSYTGSQRYDNDQANTFPGTMPTYATADLKLTHETGGWILSAVASNLFDKRYYSYAIVDSYACATPVCMYPQPGRTLFTSAEYRFR